MSRGHTWQPEAPGLSLKVPGLHAKHSDVYATPVRKILGKALKETVKNGYFMVGFSKILK